MSPTPILIIISTIKLTVPHFRVKSAVLEQSFMIALFDDAAIIHNQNNVGFLYSGKAVRYDK